jgi:catechol 2,3-dioxygenase-like lactoylglutathione lyase family enzyme
VSVLDHIGFEVSDLERSARFYDAVFYAIGGRRLYADPDVVAWGVEVPQLWLTSRGRPAPGFGHVALRAPSAAEVRAAHAAGLASGGTDAGPPGPRPSYGPDYYAAYLGDPDGLRVEVVSRSGE